MRTRSRPGSVLRHGWPPDGVVVAGGSNVLIQALVVLSGLGSAAWWP
jgi:hypothetical protein